MRFDLLPRHIQRATALALGFALTALGQSPTDVAKRFSGNWVEDQSKSTIGAARSLTFRKGSDGLEELRGTYARPLVQPVRFGTAPYTIDESKNTLVWKDLGGGRFERTIAEGGKTVGIRHITISADGKMLTEVTEDTNRPNGKKSTTTIVYARTSGSGQQLEGTWKPQSLRSDTPLSMSIEAAGGTLKISRGTGVSNVLTFDGKPSNLTGPAVISGTTDAGKIISDRVIEIDGARMGTPSGVTTWTLSADGKTLTSSAMTLGPEASKEPTVRVFQKK